jgi:hypothetical protein
MMWIRNTALVALAVVTVGCFSTSHHAIIAAPTTRASDLLEKPITFREMGPVSGRSCRFFIIALIPFGDSTPGAAIEKALLGSHADAILNVSVTTSLYGFIPIYNILSFTCTTVQGVAVRFDEEQP